MKESEGLLTIGVTSDLEFLSALPEEQQGRNFIEYYTPGSKQIVELPFDNSIGLFWRFNRIKMACALSEGPYMRESIGITEQECFKLLAKLDPEIKDIIETIRDSKLKCAVLIDSLGGKSYYKDMFIDSIGLVKRNCGEVATFVGNNAASACGHIFLEGDKRYAREDSELMMHNGSVMTSYIDGTLDRDPDMDSFYAVELERERELIQKSILNTCNPESVEEVRQRIQKAFNDATNVDSSIIFNGFEMEDFGIAEITKDLRGFYQDFYRDDHYNELFADSRAGKFIRQRGRDFFYLIAQRHLRG